MLEDNSHSERILRTCNNMRILGLACDAVLSTEDGGMFGIHGAIMSCCSTYFRTISTSLFGTNSGDEPQLRTFITIPNVPASILEGIIQYAYTGVTHATEENVQELLPEADQFGVLGLVNACSNFLVKLLYPDIFLIISSKSQNKADTFYIELSSSNLNIILQDDLLKADEEISVWNSLKRWVYYDVARHMRYVPKHLISIRLAVMLIDDFHAIVKDPIISKSIQCRPYIAKETKFIL
ncbi:Kelch-like protein 10 [Araneus ventricosus]|uniref:Kelch-like protein 10 n=1 Tax=Araneus ventricosus TaxID=182803 RepID=A0A4Y2A8F6_ARAVE|nr:Kelch-like protein 10 [Araneus ventricosus]